MTPRRSPSACSEMLCDKRSALGRSSRLPIRMEVMRSVMLTDVEINVGSATSARLAYQQHSMNNIVLMTFMD